MSYAELRAKAQKLDSLLTEAKSLAVELEAAGCEPIWLRTKTDSFWLAGLVLPTVVTVKDQLYP